MSVKVIVTDMDGTFLNDAKTYNRTRFMAQYQELKKRDIEFVVASGNQYYQLISFFPELKNEISFVAENGALVYDTGSPGRHHRPYRTYAVNLPPGGGCRRAKSFTSSILLSLSFEI